MAEPSSKAAVPSRWTAATVYPDMWVDPADDPRGDLAQEFSGERDILCEYLRIYRLTLEMKCAGLNAAQLAERSVPPSDMSLLGLLRHMADVERHWFRRVMGGEEAPRHYGTKEDPDADWHGAAPEAGLVEEAFATWKSEVENAERFVQSTEDLSTVGRHLLQRTIELREVLVHMIEEYARHCGHADLIRERIDGRVGQ